MRARDIAVGAALAGGVGWLVKVGLIWGNEGTNTDEGVVAVMYLLGLACMFLASAAAGVALTADHGVLLRILGALVGPIAFLLVFSVLDALLSPLAADGSWMRDEVEIIGAAVLALVLAAFTIAPRSSFRRANERPLAP